MTELPKVKMFYTKLNKCVATVKPRISGHYSVNRKKKNLMRSCDNTA